MRYKLWTIMVVLFFAPSYLVASEKLIVAIDLIRHGDRTPTHALPAVDYTWQEGLGQLTAEGMRQEYEMGRTFRKRYVEETHLLPPNYQRETLYVRSTDAERTLMSAESLLMGLYPAGTGPHSDDGEVGLPGAFQPVPIHTAPTKYDDVINMNVSEETYKQLMEKYVYSTLEWQQRDSKLKGKYSLWAKLTGVKIQGLDDLIYVGDTLFIHRLHHKPMPSGLSDEDIDTIIENGNWAFMAEERPAPVAVVFSTKLMHNIADYLKRGSDQHSPLKYVLLSAHDSTIASAMSYMGVPLDVPPRYASDLNFSLFKTDANSYIVRVTYNDKPVTIPACGGTVCTLDKFMEISDEYQS